MKGATPSTPSSRRTCSANTGQRCSCCGVPEIVACEARLNRRVRVSRSSPFITEMMTMSAATPRHTPNIEIQLMNETKKPRSRLRT
jgi:hypothetical protein